MGRWQRYWFEDGGRVALAYVRIAVAAAVACSLARIGAHSDELVAPAAIYRPVGIWMLLGHTPPPPPRVDVLWAGAWISTLAMLCGWCARTATTVSFIASVALASLVFSGKPTSWSHQYNVVFLAQLALCGGRVGDALSIDALIRRLRGRPPCVVPNGYQWSLRLAQLAVALMFASAAFFKLAQGQFTLRWALSDSLRHHILVRFDLAGLERPPVAAWLVESVWRYRSAALLNLVAQLAPLVAVFFVRRPWIRATAGALFVMEVVALGLVVDLWDQHWLPLAAVFVDWDRLAQWTTQRPPLPPASAAPVRPSRTVHVFVIAFVGYDVLCSFVPTLDRRLNTYPFSAFSMYSKVRALPPYDEHRDYGVGGDHFESTNGAPLPDETVRFLHHRYRGTYNLKTAAQLRARLALMSERIGIALRHRLVLFVAPAYPAPAALIEHPIAITGEVTADGAVRSVRGRWHATTIELAPEGVEVTGEVHFLLYERDMPTPTALPTRRIGPATWELGAITADPAWLVVVIDGTPWLAASRRSWRWGE